MNEDKIYNRCNFIFFIKLFAIINIIDVVTTLNVLRINNNICEINPLFNYLLSIDIVVFTIVKIIFIIFTIWLYNIFYIEVHKKYAIMSIILINTILLFVIFNNIFWWFNSYV